MDGGGGVGRDGCLECQAGKEGNAVSDCPKCGEPLEQHEHLTPEEFAAVTETWIDRLRSAMGRAGCNDVFPDEFPDSVVGRFHSDLAVLEAWEEIFDRQARRSA